MNSSKKTSKRELLIKFSGPILFSLFFAALCVGIFKFLPEDAPINSEYIISVKETNNDEEEWQKSILVNPSEYHAKVVEHKTQKTDLGLELFRSPVSRPSVVDLISGFGLVPIDIITQSTSIVNSLSALTCGRRRPDSSGSPSSISTQRIPPTKLFSSGRISIGLVKSLKIMPSSFA